MWKREPTASTRSSLPTRPRWTSSSACCARSTNRRDDMKITVVGRGNVGGGLADRWERAGHAVTRLGRDGGDASDADVVLVAVPGSAIADALGKVSGLEGKVVID